MALAAVAMGIAAAPVPAKAVTQISGDGVCNATSTQTFSRCVAFQGNLLNNSSIGDLNGALDLLVGGDYSPNVTWATLDPTKLLISGSGSDPVGAITFAQDLFGMVILGVHFGDAGSGLGDRTQFYLFDFTSGPLTAGTQLQLNTQGFSSGVLMNGAVPEPGTWAMMLIGFASIGTALRRSRRRERQAFLQVA
jgi:hypothetical protein